MIPLPLLCDPSPLSKGRGFRDQQKSVRSLCCQRSVNAMGEAVNRDVLPESDLTASVSVTEEAAWEI